MSDYEVGDVVCMQPFSGARRYVKVESKTTHKGQNGFDGHTIDMQLPVWGYDHQIVAVNNRHRAPLVSF